VELEGRIDALRRRGLNAAALSYDVVPALKHAADRLKLSFPMLSDPESVYIRSLNAVNPRTDGAAFGGTILTDHRGIVRSKYFTEEPRERWSLGTILLIEGEAPEGAREMRADHFVVRAGASSIRAAPQQRITLVLDFAVAPGHHVYAPGAHRYRPLGLRLDAHELVRLHETRYPQSRPFHYQPLNETVPVFVDRFRVTRDVTFEWGRPMYEFLKNPTHAITLTGHIDYQVCTERVCYPPASFPVSWTIDIVPFDEGRVPEAFRRRPASR
jgi:hypothetical protein